MGSSRSVSRLSGLASTSHFELIGKLKTTITSKNSVENENGFSVHIIRNSMRFTRIFCAVRNSVAPRFSTENLFRFFSYSRETIEIRVSNLFIAIFLSVLKPPSTQTHKHTSAAPAHQSLHNDTKSVSQTIVFFFFLLGFCFAFFGKIIIASKQNMHSTPTTTATAHRQQHCLRVYLQSTHTKCLCYILHIHTPSSVLLFCATN